MYVCLFVDCEGQSMRPIGDVSEVEIHQGADVEVTEMHLWE